MDDKVCMCVAGVSLRGCDWNCEHVGHVGTAESEKLCSSLFVIGSSYLVRMVSQYLDHLRTSSVTGIPFYTPICSYREAEVLTISYWYQPLCTCLCCKSPCTGKLDMTYQYLSVCLTVWMTSSNHYLSCLPILIFILYWYINHSFNKTLFQSPLDFVRSVISQTFSHLLNRLMPSLISLVLFLHWSGLNPNRFSCHLNWIELWTATIVFLHLVIFSCLFANWAIWSNGSWRILRTSMECPIQKLCFI